MSIASLSERSGSAEMRNDRSVSLARGHQELDSRLGGVLEAHLKTRQRLTDGQW